MKNLCAVTLLGLALVTVALLWLTPYRYTRYGGIPVRVHRITGRTEVLNETDGAFFWRVARRPALPKRTAPVVVPDPERDKAAVDPFFAEFERAGQPSAPPVPMKEGKPDLDALADQIVAQILARRKREAAEKNVPKGLAAFRAATAAGQSER